MNQDVSGSTGPLHQARIGHTGITEHPYINSLPYWSGVHVFLKFVLTKNGDPFPFRPVWEWRHQLGEPVIEQISLWTVMQGMDRELFSLQLVF